MQLKKGKSYWYLKSGHRQKVKVLNPEPNPGFSAAQIQFENGSSDLAYQRDLFEIEFLETRWGKALIAVLLLISGSVITILCQHVSKDYFKINF